ncbi:hypothetical protein [Gynuella sp.]|uniref:hypothetical protein n=1 Tax=Gynuella sp. TaxID=2969146 RepID=UPI003D0D48F5
MMTILQQATLQRQDESAELNLQQLYEQGLQQIQRWSKQIWTDYNVHDPGMTTLEILCYALTDLSYRASMPITDLLASPTDNAANMAEQFFSARQILTNRPLTELDYRKLLIDLPGIKNAWILPLSSHCYVDLPHAQLLADDPGSAGVERVNIQGRYQVRLDFNEDLTVTEQQDATQLAQDTLHANRSLCEDFVTFSAVETEPYRLCGNIELQKDASVNEVKARILFAVQNYLAPVVHNYRLSEVLAKTKADGRHYRSDDIFNGPSLTCGFILDDELRQAELRSEIRLSDLINILMDIPGILAVTELIITPVTAMVAVEDRWRQTIPAGKKAVLDQAGSRLIFHKGVMPIVPQPDQVEAELTTLQQQQRLKLDTASNEDLPIPLGHFRNPGQYTSLQHDFPSIYGLGDTGVPPGLDPNHPAKVLQLRAYLLFMEQILANYFAQLAHIRELFCTDPTQLRSYFYQTVNSFTDWQKIYADADPVASLENQIEDKVNLVDRRSRFLDHLIARFAEQFTDLAHIMYSSFEVGPETLIQYKCEFLKQYPSLSRDRSLAYNYHLQDDEALWNSDNISGLERRLTALLGIRNSRRRNLSEISYDIYAEIDTTPDDEFRFRIRHRLSNAILLSSSTHYSTTEEATAAMTTAIFHASNPNGYSRKLSSNQKHYFNIVNDNGEVVARRIEYFDQPEMMESAIAELIDYLRLNYSDEGLYLIENILLWPEQPDDPFLPVCVDRQCDSCEEHDPYSYRIHIILPAYAARFSNQDFRHFAESVIRAEVPAHIMPKICWISQADMASLESVYRAWISVKSGRTSADRQTILQSLIERLYNIKNVYPTEQLYDCSDPATDSRFILNNTALGSLSTASDSESPDQ